MLLVIHLALFLLVELAFLLQSVSDWTTRLVHVLVSLGTNIAFSKLIFLLGYLALDYAGLLLCQVSLSDVIQPITCGNSVHHFKLNKVLIKTIDLVLELLHERVVLGVFNTHSSCHRSAASKVLDSWLELNLCM